MPLSFDKYDNMVVTICSLHSSCGFMLISKLRVLDLQPCSKIGVEDSSEFTISCSFLSLSVISWLRFSKTVFFTLTSLRL